MINTVKKYVISVLDNISAMEKVKVEQGKRNRENRMEEGQNMIIN